MCIYIYTYVQHMSLKILQPCSSHQFIAGIRLDVHQVHHPKGISKHTMMSFWQKKRDRLCIPSIITYLLLKGQFQTPLFSSTNQWEKDIYVNRSKNAIHIDQPHEFLQPTDHALPGKEAPEAVDAERWSFVEGGRMELQLRKNGGLMSFNCVLMVF